MCRLEYVNLDVFTKHLETGRLTEILDAHSLTMTTTYVRSVHAVSPIRSSQKLVGYREVLPPHGMV